MRLRGSVMLALASAGTGLLLAAAFVTSDGGVLSIPIACLLIVVLGLALISMRVRRLGAFGGALGTPAEEARMHERITRESERAVRYGRQLSVVLLREAPGSRLAWPKHLRTSDEALIARRGQTLLLLPETPREGALQVVQRVAVLTERRFERVHVCSLDPVRGADYFVEQVVAAVRDWQPGVTLGNIPEPVRNLSVRT